MTPKWLVPVLAIIAAIAVGVAATIVGLRFLPHDTVQADPGTVISPVLEPVASGDGDLPTEPDEDWGLSQSLGETEVTPPSAVPPSSDPAFEEALERISGSSDPEGEIHVLEEEAAAAAAETEERRPVRDRGGHR